MFASLNARALGWDQSAAETLALAERAGFEGVDLLVRDLVDRGDDPHSLRARMNAAGLRGGAWPLPVHWRGTAEEFRRDLDRLPRYAAAAATLGLSRTGTWVMPETPSPVGPDGAEFAATVDLHRERLGAVARVLSAEGVRLGLEVIGVASSRTGRGVPFVTRTDDLDRVRGGVWAWAPNLGVLVDGFHLFAAGEPVEAALRWGVGRVVWVHVADLPASATDDREAIRDGDRGLPGEHPAVDTAALLARLAEAGYNGPVTAEPMADCRSLRGLDPVAAARKVREALHSVWPRGSLRGRPSEAME